MVWLWNYPHQTLCDYSRSLKSLANLKKIARGDFLYKFWTFRRSRIITQYLPKFGVDISHNSAKISKFTSHGIHLAKIKPQKPWTWNIIFWTQIHHSSPSFYSTLLCMEGQIQNWIWLVENYRGMVPTIITTNPTWVELDSTKWLWIFISNICRIGCNDWKWFSNLTPRFKTFWNSEKTRKHF